VRSVGLYAIGQEVNHDSLLDASWRVEPPHPRVVSRVPLTVRRLLPLSLALLALLLAAPAAEAKKRTVPQGFYGAMWDGGIASASPGIQRRQFAFMARSGVEAVRTVFSWRRAQPDQETPPDFSAFDRIVGNAARHRIGILPVVIEAPEWAALYPGRFRSPPRGQDYVEFLSQLAERYGPDGNLWLEHPTLRYRPIRFWQIWNEPHLQFFWNARGNEEGAWPQGYVDLLRESDRALKRVDPGSRTVLAGLTDFSWRWISSLYELGAGPYFDVAAVQTFSSTPTNWLRALRKVRRAMNAAGDTRKPIWSTEFTLPAARGRTRAPSYQRKLQTTDRGMARFLTKAYRLAARHRKALKLKRAYWYTWASGYNRRGIFRYAGLGKYRNGRFLRMRAWRAFVSSARAREGCRKTSFGVCRR
jgi:polysaccharide biosynthesis protein PslG